MNREDPVTRAEARVEPSGFLMATVTYPLLELVIFTLIRWPTEPAKVYPAFWPGVLMVAVTWAPEGVGVMAPERSGGTSYTVRVMVSVTAPLGSIRTVEVPATGRVAGS